MDNFDLAKQYFLNGCELFASEKFSQAECQFNLSLECIPDRISTLINLSATQLKLKKYSEAKATAQKLLSIDCDSIEAYLNLGLIEKELKKFDTAIHFFDKALSLDKNYVEGWTNKGNILHELKRYEEAIAHYDKALSLRPEYAEGWCNKAIALHELRRYEEAIAHYDKALRLKPDFAEGLSKKGISLMQLKLYGEALKYFDQAISLKPRHSESWFNKAEALNCLKRHPEAAQCYMKALDFEGKETYLQGKSHHQMMLTCDWTHFDKKITELFQLTVEGKLASEPFGFQGVASSEKLIQKCAELYSDNQYPLLGHLSKNSKYQHSKIRIGYVCGELRHHATSILMTRVWELHDQSKFEIYAFDNGWDDGSEYRQRIKNAFNKMVDITRLSDMEAAQLIRSKDIDILINLNGFFGLSRQGIFAYKPAPIQINYLGFPGTIGAKYIDYIIADKVVIPEDSKCYYTEKVVYLPNSYQANDNTRIVSNKKFFKSDFGLPEQGFIFACFNNNYKITPMTFDSWMRILRRAPKSVLWLLADNPFAKNNLIKEAEIRGVDSSRLIFSDRIFIREHLARHQLADLFLDTSPYNAHTTCSDALYSGLPVLTYLGTTFPGRVAASLLNAVGLPELITGTQEEYEALAIELANNPKKLADIKLKLSQNRLTAPLFDTPLFTRNLEAAYLKMHERHQMNLSPDHILVS